MRSVYLLLIIPCSLFAQTTTFQKQYDFGFSEYGYVHVLSDSSYAVIGGTDQFPGERHFIMRADTSGSLQWAKAYSIGSAQQGGLFCNGIPLQSGGFLLNESISTGGFTFSNRTTQTDAVGNVIYSNFQVFRNGNSEIFADQMQTSDGYIVSVAATNMGPAFVSGAISVYKCDTLGNLLWNIGIETDTTMVKESPTDILECGDGNYLVSGRSINPLNGNMDCYLIKISPAGIVLWKKLYGTASYEMALSVGELSDGSILISGMTVVSSSWQPVLFKTDASGNLIWSKKYNTTFPDVMFGSILVKSDQQIIISGQGGSAQSAPVLIAFDSAGNVQWSRYYDLPSSSDIYNAQMTPDNGFIISCVLTDSLTGSRDIVLIKSDSIGKSGCLGTIFTCTPSAIAFTEYAYGWEIAGGVIVSDSSSVTDYTGTTALLCPIDDGIPEYKNGFSLWFENPCSGTVVLHAAEPIESIEIYTAGGQLYSHQENLNTRNPILCLPAENGIYFLVVANENGELVRKEVCVLN